MDEIAVDRNGWINVFPLVEDEDLPPTPSALSSLISARGPSIPLATWHPGEQKRRRVEPPSIGIQHASGPKAVARLADLGHPVPEGWRLLADSPKRGLVLAVPPDAAHEDVLRWLIGAAAALTFVPLTGRWQALVY
jgi:hypothetical protein